MEFSLPASAIPAEPIASIERPMFLRSLTLRGFKSFADKTTLEFTPGISVIVGPNGSGKSNIADAIAWVLGEQGPRALRGGQMTDVIFAGSPNRPALGMTEVRMVIDNTAGLIPVPASEIEISRTVYRSGESEYRLGGRPCRLLDIQELLSDTGVGRSLHTIIGQGQLDAILSARPEERRQFVEEAAGIAKYRRRRERAERKLAGLEQDLLRLQDLAAELRRQLRPLKQQAELAGRHETLSQEAVDLARKLAAARLRQVQREHEELRPAWEEFETRRVHGQTALASIDADIARLEGERGNADAEQRRAEEAHAAALSEKSGSEDRLRTAIRLEAQARERLATASNRSGRLFAIEEELQRTEAALSEVRATLAGREGELEEAERSFRHAEQARRDADEERRRISEQNMARRAEAEALRRTLEGHEAERARLTGSLQEVRNRMAAAETRAAELKAEIERLDGLETPLAEEQATLEHQRSEMGRILADLEAEEQGLLARQEVIEARREELAESPGAAFLRRRGNRPIGLLRDLIDAPADLVPAVRAALGQFADAVVYQDLGKALADAAVEPTGGVTLAVEGAVESTPPSLLGERSLLLMVRPDQHVRGLAGALLGEVYLVNNLAEAEAKHRVHPNVHFVTREGALVGPAFVRTAHGRDARLEDVRRMGAALDREMARVHRGLRETRQRLMEVAGRAEVVGRGLEEADRSITAAADEMAGQSADLAALAREQQLLSERSTAVEAAIFGLGERLSSRHDASIEPAPLPPIAEPPIHLRVEVEALRRDRARLEAGVERARRELGTLAAEDPIALRQSLAEAEAERAGAEVRLTETEAALTDAHSAYRTATETARRIQAEHDKAVQSWRDQAAAAERLRLEHEDEDRARHDLERRMADAERLLREGHGTEPAEAVAELAPDDTVDELARRADLVARRLGLLGKVNLLAGGELDSVQQRHDFLVRELEDVKAARRDLLQMIEDIDRRVGEQFETAFADVAREFASLFVMMFPGGEGRLSLSDPQDLLNSGIEVEARPGRGRVKRLSLLSGGERSLAALAFLFAIFKARPSPFYLMDEVEAALDDVNLHRFLEVVHDLARESQILVVTHQKRTMETADALYGVSLGRDGSSTVISQRLAEAAVR
jgi:chromosome segregation protein